MILIIGRGFVGSEIASKIRSDVKLYVKDAESENTHCKVISHSDDYKAVIQQERPNLVVNAAAIAGQKKCVDAGWQAVKTANIDFARHVAETALKYGSKCLLLSTGGVYAKPHSTPKREDDECYASNFYIESKIKMEDAVRDMDVTVFRIPVILGAGYYPTDFINRIRSWQWTQDAYAHLLYMGTLHKAVRHIADHKVCGIFNIADHEFVHLPRFVEDHYRKLPVWKEDEVPESFTQTHLLDTTKARRAGLL